MFLNNYEIIYVLKPNITEEVNLAIAHEYKSIIKKNGGNNIFVQHRGRRHLSYNIANHYDAIYVQMSFEGNGKIVSLLEKAMKFNEDIIRYLTTKQNLVIKPEISI